MKSPDTLLFTAALAVVLAGCGQTGPLYMPVKPPKPATPPATVATPAPVQTPSPAPAQ